MSIPEGNKASIARYKKKTILRYEFNLNKHTNVEEIEWFNAQPNKRDYLLTLIREDMQRRKPR